MPKAEEASAAASVFRHVVIAVRTDTIRREWSRVLVAIELARVVKALGELLMNFQIERAGLPQHDVEGDLAVARPHDILELDPTSVVIAGSDHAGRIHSGVHRRVEGGAAFHRRGIAELGKRLVSRHELLV